MTQDNGLASAESPLAAGRGIVIPSWRLLLVSTVVGLAIAAITIIRMQPMYRAEVTVVSTRTQQGSGLGEIVRGLGGLTGAAVEAVLNSGDLDQDLALIRSRAFTVSFARERNLLPQMFPERWDKASQRWLVRRPWFSDVEKSLEPTAQEIYDLFDGRRSLQADEDAGIVVLRLEWPDPVTAAELANELVAAANQYARARVARESALSIEYLNRQLASSSVLELRAMLHGLFEDQTKRAMLAEVREDFVFSVIDPAISPERPIRPRPLLYFVSSVAAVTLLGMFLSALRAHSKAARTNAAS
jgi:uncharacterized protein involved in exopolysaccharide biosynthesis